MADDPVGTCFCYDCQRGMDVADWRRLQVTSCRKCGGTDIYTRYHKNRDDCSRYAPLRAPAFDGEHLHRTCRGCGYEWADKTLDATREEAGVV